jgi:hypothetical protein
MWSLKFLQSPQIHLKQYLKHHQRFTSLTFKLSSLLTPPRLLRQRVSGKLLSNRNSTLYGLTLHKRSMAMADTMIANGGDTCTTSPPKKLHGRAFYESIGKPKFVVAPMVDQSEFVSSSIRLQHAQTLTYRPSGMATTYPLFHDTRNLQATPRIQSDDAFSHVS